MNGHTLDKVGLGVNALEIVEVACIVEKIVESHLRWFRHVWRIIVETPIRIIDQM